MSDELTSLHFVSLFRSVAPYINLFRGKTFVLAFGGKAISGTLAKSLAYDVNLLAALGVRLVLVHGARPQIEEELREKGIESRTHGGYRITDSATLDCVIDAVGSVYLEIDALLSQGLPDTPMANSTIRVIKGNFITAKPLGVLDGVDMQYAGSVRKIDAEGIRSQLGIGNIVILSCLGASPTGEIFNLAMEEVATSVAMALKADKLIFLTEVPGIRVQPGEPASEDNPIDTELPLASAEALLAQLPTAQHPTDTGFYLQHCVKACKAGVERSHIIPFALDGSLLLEVYVHDGIGTMVIDEKLEELREATIDDVGGILQLIEPYRRKARAPAMEKSCSSASSSALAPWG